MTLKDMIKKYEKVRVDIQRQQDCFDKSQLYRDVEVVDCILDDLHKVEKVDLGSKVIEKMGDAVKNGDPSQVLLWIEVWGKLP
jgi:hypothetical protein